MLDWHYLDWWLFWVRPTGFPTNQSWFIFQTQRVTLGTEGISQVLTSPNTSLLPTQSLECENAPCSISISERRTESLTSHPGSVSMHRSNEPSISRVLCSQELSFPHSKLYPYYPAECFIQALPVTNDKMNWAWSLAALLGGNPFPLFSEHRGSGKERGMKQRRMGEEKRQWVSLWWIWGHWFRA